MASSTQDGASIRWSLCTQRLHKPFLSQKIIYYRRRSFPPKSPYKLPIWFKLGSLPLQILAKIKVDLRHPWNTVTRSSYKHWVLCIPNDSICCPSQLSTGMEEHVEKHHHISRSLPRCTISSIPGGSLLRLCYPPKRHLVPCSLTILSWLQIYRWHDVNAS